MNKESSKLQLRQICVITCLIHVIIYLCWLGIRSLDVSYIDWMLRGDLGLEYFGSLFFANSEWHFPIGLMNRLSYPSLRSVVYYDSLPLLAIIGKLLRGILPGSFQLFGIYELFCFVMQGVLGACCIYKFIKNKWICILGSLFFSSQLAFLSHLYLQIPLSSHYVLLSTFLFALYYNSLTVKQKIGITVGIVSLTMFIQTAFLPMVLCILFFRVLAEVCIEKNFKSLIQGIAIGSFGIIGIAAASWILGLFHGNTSLSGGGLGTASIRLDSFINPFGYSMLFSIMTPAESVQFNNSLAYLGTGIILLICFIMLCIIRETKNKKVLLLTNAEKIYLICAFAGMLICLFFALGPTATWKDVVVYEIPLSPVMYKLWSMVRSCYRLAWAIVYGMIIIVFWAFSKLNLKSKWAYGIIFVSVFLQIIDLAPFYRGRGETGLYSSNVEHHTALTSEVWYDLAQSKEKILFMNEDNRNNSIGVLAAYRPEELYDFAVLAYENHMSLNDFYDSRKDGITLASERTKVWEDLYSGITDDSAIYIFMGNPIRLMQEKTLNFYQINGYLVGLTDTLEKEYEDVRKQEYQKGQSISVLPLATEYLNNGRRGENGERIINPQGKSSGPRLTLNKGKYKIEILGENLTVADIYCLINGKRIFTEDMIITDNKVTYSIDLTELTYMLEFVVENISNETVVVNDILLEEVIVCGQSVKQQ